MPNSPAGEAIPENAEMHEADPAFFETQGEVLPAEAAERLETEVAGTERQVQLVAHGFEAQLKSHHVDAITAAEGHAVVEDFTSQAVAIGKETRTEVSAVLHPKAETSNLNTYGDTPEAERQADSVVKALHDIMGERMHESRFSIKGGAEKDNLSHRLAKPGEQGDEFVIEIGRDTDPLEAATRIADYLDARSQKAEARPADAKPEQAPSVEDAEKTRVYPDHLEDPAMKNAIEGILAATNKYMGEVMQGKWGKIQQEEAKSDWGKAWDKIFHLHQARELGAFARMYPEKATAYAAAFEPLRRAQEQNQKEDEALAKAEEAKAASGHAAEERSAPEPRLYKNPAEDPLVREVLRSVRVRTEAGTQDVRRSEWRSRKGPVRQEDEARRIQMTEWTKFLHDHPEQAAAYRSLLEPLRKAFEGEEAISGTLEKAARTADEMAAGGSDRNAIYADLQREAWKGLLKAHPEAVAAYRARLMSAFSERRAESAKARIETFADSLEEKAQAGQVVDALHNLMGEKLNDHRFYIKTGALADHMSYRLPKPGEKEDELVIEIGRDTDPGQAAAYIANILASREPKVESPPLDLRRPEHKYGEELAKAVAEMMPDARRAVLEKAERITGIIREQIGDDAYQELGIQFRLGGPIASLDKDGKILVNLNVLHIPLLEAVARIANLGTLVEAAAPQEGAAPEEDAAPGKEESVPASRGRVLQFDQRNMSPGERVPHARTEYFDARQRLAIGLADGMTPLEAERLIRDVEQMARGAHSEEEARGVAAEFAENAELSPGETTLLTDALLARHAYLESVRALRNGLMATRRKEVEAFALQEWGYGPYAPDDEEGIRNYIEGRMDHYERSELLEKMVLEERELVHQERLACMPLTLREIFHRTLARTRQRAERETAGAERVAAPPDDLAVAETLPPIAA